MGFGTLLGGDVIFIAVFTWGLTQSNLRDWFLSTPILFLPMTLFLAATFLLDNLNNVPINDIYRGLNRNGIFAASMLGGLFVNRFYGLKGWAILLFWMTLGAPVFAYYADSSNFQSIQTFIKYGGGTLLFAAIIIVTSEYDKKVGILFLVAGAGIAFFNSCRGVAIVGVTVSVFMVVTPFKSVRAGLAFMLGLALFVLANLPIFTFDESIISDMLGEDVALQQSRSSLQRKDMAVDSWNLFTDNPYTGVGSWQQMRNYEDALGQTDSIGVHSIFLQLTCEYGIIGLLMGSFIAIITIAAVCKIVFSNTTESDMVRVALFWSAISIGYGLTSSPFVSYSRFLFGFMLSGLIFVLWKPEKIRAALVKPFPALVGNSETAIVPL